MSSSTFSYAQAAKGRTAVQSSPQPSPSPAPPSISSQGKDDATTATNSVTAPSITSNDSDLRDTGKPIQPEGEFGIKRHASDAVATEEPAHTASNSTVEPTSHAFPNGDSASIESVQNQTRSASQTSRSADGDLRKGRKGKKPRSSDKDNDPDKDQDEEKEMESRPILLSEAPIPSVNIWQKRIELQAAKVKVAPSTSSSSAVAAAPAIVGEESRRRSLIEGIGTQRTPQQGGANGEKPQRKSADFSRTADQPPRRGGPRGARAAEAVPSVSDTSLWPDPKSAATNEDGKRRPQDKVDRSEKEAQDDMHPVKRQKEKWVAVPYVPSVVYQTPLPQRGSKPRGGARGGRDAGSRGAHSSAVAAGSASATSPTDKIPAAAGATVAKESRPREGSGPTRTPSLPPSASKRASTDGGYARELRKPNAPAGADRPRDSTSDQSAQYVNGKSENMRPSRAEFAQGHGDLPQHFARPNLSDRRADPALKGFDGFKEGGPPAAKDQMYPVRERGEGRGERGRGGFRGRGGHNGSVGAHPSMSGFPPTGQYAVQNIPGPYSPPLHQNAFGGGFGSGPARGGGRGNGRANSGSASFSRGATNGGGPPSKLGHVNTNLGGPDYAMNPFSAYAFPPPFYEPVIIQTLMSQVEYYLSVDNLCKDYFIRKRMDSKGFVRLTVIANFNRMRDLAPDLDHIRIACEASDNIDYVVGDDNIERLRLRNKWEIFVLSMEEREEEARNDGPSQWVSKSRHSTRSSYPGPMMMPNYMPTSPTAYPPLFSPEDQMFQPPYMNGAHYDPAMNGGDTNGQRYGMESQLSAAVPEFSPSGPGPFTLENATTFSDKQVEGLKVLVGYGKKDSPGADNQAHPAGPVANGAVNAPDHVQSNGTASPPGAPFSTVAQSVDSIETRSAASSYPNVIWAEQHTGEASAQEEEPYTVFRKKALDERQASQPGETPRAMKNLYKFWSHFLIGKFNAKMYSEFRTYAIEDVSGPNPSKDGLKCLVRYYKQLFSPDSPKPWGNDRTIPEIFTLHYQEAMTLDPNMSTNGDAGI